MSGARIYPPEARTKHAKRRAGLTKHGHGGNSGDCQAKGGGDFGQQGLDKLNIGNDHADRDGHQPDGRLRHQGLFRGLCEGLRSSLGFIHSLFCGFERHTEQRVAFKCAGAKSEPQNQTPAQGVGEVSVGEQASRVFIHGEPLEQKGRPWLER